MFDVVTRYYIVSAQKTNLDDLTNTTRHHDLINALQQIGYNPQPVLGKYAGMLEQSVIIAGSPETENLLNKIIKDYDQESYLIVYYDNAAELVYQDGSRKTIGKLNQVNDPKGQDFTKVGDKFYALS